MKLSSILKSKSVIIFIIGIALGIYFGLYLLFIGGIVGIIEIIQSNTVSYFDVFINLIKIIMGPIVTSLIIWLSIFFSLFYERIFKKEKIK